eukprot:3187745-Rhodomonas_salina.1
MSAYAPSTEFLTPLARSTKPWTHGSKPQGFHTAGFEESIWICKAGGEYEHDLIVSAHIDDTLMACKSIDTLECFKTPFWTRFEGTDEGDVTTYLGGELIRDRPNRTITYRQSVYARKILQIYDAWDKPHYVNPALHLRYHGITGHLLFLVTMTRCYLAFAYAELSKFVQAPGEVHLRAAERTLQYLRGSFELGLTYSDPGPARRNILQGW